MDDLHDAVMAGSFCGTRRPEFPSGIYLKLLEANPVLYGDPPPAEPRCLSERLSASEQGLVEALRTIGDGDRVARLFGGLVRGLKRARAIHPDYCCGPYEALGNLEAEVGEVAQEIVKGRDGWQGRAEQEVNDVIVVAMRYLLGEHVKEGCNG